MANVKVPGMAEAIEARRLALEMDVQALVDATGVTRQGLGPLLRGDRKNYQDRLKFAVCAALGWSPDSIDLLLAGEPPVVTVVRPKAFGLQARVERLAGQVEELMGHMDQVRADLDELRRRDDRA